MFSSLPHIHWCVAFCAVKTDLHRDCDTPLDGPPSVDSTSSSRHRFIARYRPTIVLIAAGSRSVHSMRWNQMLAQNRDFCLPHLHSMSPLGGGGFPSEYCHDVSYGKREWCGYPMVNSCVRLLHSRANWRVLCSMLLTPGTLCELWNTSSVCLSGAHYKSLLLVAVYCYWRKFEDIFIRFDRMYERDRRADGHRITA